MDIITLNTKDFSYISQMANVCLIIAFFLVTGICWTQETELRRLNIKIKRLNRKTGVLQKDVDDIWSTILEAQDCGKNTRRTDFCTNVRNVTSKVNGALTTVQELKTEVEHFTVSSRNGFRNEKSWQREAIRNLTQSYKDFKTGVTGETKEVKDRLQRLNTETARIDETNNEILRDTGKEFERINKILDDHSTEQSRLETENHELKVIISEMRNDNQQKLSRIEAELTRKIRAVQKDYQERQTNLETENQALKQTIHEMKSNQEEIKDVTSLQTTLPPLQKKSPPLKTTTEPTALLNPCDEGWESFNDHCYLFVKVSKTWDDASAFCESMNSYSIELTTDAEFEFIGELQHENFPYRYSSFWIGATDRDNEGTFVYHHSKLHVPEKFWRLSQPDNKFGIENCAELLVDPVGGGTIYDQICHLTRHFYCELS